jgi:hypothetical protein
VAFFRLSVARFTHDQRPRPSQNATTADFEHQRGAWQMSGPSRRGLAGNQREAFAVCIFFEGAQLGLGRCGVA